jgi:integrase
VSRELSFRQAFLDFMDLKVANGKSDNTVVSYLLAYNKLFGLGTFKDAERYHWPVDTMVHEVNNEMVVDLVNARLKEGLKRSSVNAELRSIRAAFNYALDTRKCRGPEDGKIDWQVTKNSHKRRMVTLEEEDAILEWLTRKAEWARVTYGKNRAYLLAKDLFLFNVEHGCRIGETLGLIWSSVDFENETFEVHRPKVAHSGEGENEYATLIFTPLSREVLERRYKEMRESNHPDIQKGPEARVFQKTHRAVKILREAIHTVCNRPKPELVKRKGTATIHTLRDTFASRLVLEDVHMQKVMTLLGHTSPQMSVKYTHLTTRKSSEQAKDAIGSYRAKARTANR